MLGSSERERRAKWNALCQAGMSKYEAGAFEEALDLFNKAEAAWPGGYQVHLNRGNVLCRLGRPALALRELDIALARKPGFMEIYFQRGLARAALGDMLGAIEEFSLAHEANPKAWGPIRQRGQVYFDMGEFGKAALDFERLQDLSPKNWVGFYHAGVCYRFLERWPEAFEALTRAEELKPQACAYYWHLSYALEGLGLYEEALAADERAIELNPDDPQPPLRRIEILRAWGKTDRADAEERRVYGEQDRLVREVAGAGKFVWGAVVQANNKMFEPGAIDLPGVVAFTFDRTVLELGHVLMRTARRVFATKGKRFSDPEMMAPGLITTHEMTDESVRVKVPAALCPEAEVFCQSIGFLRRYLPRRRLDIPLIPCAAETGSECRIVQLPWNIGQAKAGLLGLPPEEATSLFR